MKKGVSVSKKQPQNSIKNPKKPKNGRGQGALQALAVTTTIGTELGITTTLGFFIGRYLDNKFATAPLFLVICLLFGMGIGIMAIIHTLNSLFKDKGEGVK